MSDIEQHIQQHRDAQDDSRHDHMLTVVLAPHQHQIHTADAAEDRYADKAVDQRREEQHHKIDDCDDRQPRAELCPQEGADILRLLLIDFP